MKVVLFCGGQGMRIREFSHNIPKPMVPLRGKPILWYVMRYYAHYGHTHFILCLGYKADKIIDYVTKKKRLFGDWTFEFVETGLDATIADRLCSVRTLVENEKQFLANYSDGVSDVPLNDVIALNDRHKSICTFVTVRPHISYHLVQKKSSGLVTGITPTIEGWINGGFFVMRPRIFDLLHAGEEIVIEGFERMIKQGQLFAYEYNGFWQSCDTFKDLMNLESLAKKEPAPWEIWA